MGVCGDQMKMDVKCVWDSVFHLSTLNEITVITTMQKLPKEQIILKNFAKTYYSKVSVIVNLCRPLPLLAIAKVNQQLTVFFTYL